jgi:peroxiredoxin
MTIKAGDRIPDGKLTLMGADRPENVTAQELLGKGKVVLFSVPGAFTPTCNAKHLPGFVQKAGALRARGVGKIVCMAVNDVFVMNAWKKSSGVTEEIEFLADGSGQFAHALGLEVDLSGGGLGIRSKRYSMLVDDGVVKILNIEDTPGKADVSGAKNLLTMI